MKKIFIIVSVSLLILGGIVFYQKAKFEDGKLHLVFCNVGQGDAIFIRSPEGLDILVDGGPDDSILSCLSNNMPFWDRSIELMILTHPHADHLNGLTSVIKRYSVMQFATEKLSNDTAMFREFMNLINRKKISLQYVYSRDKFSLTDGTKITFLGPSSEFLERSSPGGIIGETNEFASLVTLFNYGRFRALLTGDSQAFSLEEFIGGQDPVDVLQVPHHGSKTGLNEQILNQLNPKLAVISVGKNKYGHPTQEMLGLLGNQDPKDGQEWGSGNNFGWENLYSDFQITLRLAIEFLLISSPVIKETSRFMTPQKNPTSTVSSPLPSANFTYVPCES